MGISGTQKAKMFALSGVARFGATRFGYTSSKVFVAVNGVQVADAAAVAANTVVRSSLSVSESLNQVPNTATFALRGAQPTEGQSVVVTIGSINNLDRTFGGTIINRGLAFKSDAQTLLTSSVNAIDYTWQLTHRRFSGQFTNAAPGDIAAAIAAVVPGLTLWVQSGLDNLDTFSQTDVTALEAFTALASRIGGYFNVDYHNVAKLFITDDAVSDPVALTSSHATLSDISFVKDLSQVRTRVFVEGGGVTSLTQIDPGETILPLSTIAWYNADAGGIVKSGAQHLTYTGAQTGGAGTLIGTGTSPASAPVAAVASGTGLGSGIYTYAYTDVTASGESLPSPLGTVTLGGTLVDPTTAPSISFTNSGGGGPYPIVSGGTYQWAYTFITATGETLPTPVVPRTPGAGGPYYGIVFNIAVGGAGTTGRRVYRTVNGGAQLKLVGTIADNTTTTYDDHIADGSLGANVPTSNTAVTGTQASVSAIAIGASPTTSRKLYRTAVGGSQLKLLTTIADNTTTTYADSTADGSLGANVPTSDTSGLTQPDGQILAGATTLLVAGAGAFSASGGWAVIGNGQQLIRYTGVSGNTLTGVPASGIGAITATVSYNSTITATPALTGIPSSGTGAVAYSILQGDQVNLLVQVDDTAAQSALATLLGGSSDGVIEDFIQDGTIGQDEATARGQALLDRCSSALVTVRFKSRDRNTRAGRTITVTWADPINLSQDFLIQQITADTFVPGQMPTVTAEASTDRFSLDNLLRLERKAV